jgi:glutathione-regulated potassium-efflux system ancillary protein KefG
MRRVLVLYAHPGQRHSQANILLSRTATTLEGITFIDLYAQYPRFKIAIDAEQQRLVEHDVVVFQFPVYWYSTPSLLKEWQDLVLEYGFAYGQDGDKLAGKVCLLALTAGGPAQAYTKDGSNHARLRALFSPLEQTAKLCQMEFLPPFVLFSSLTAGMDGRGEEHAAAYRRLLAALRDDSFDIAAARSIELLSLSNLPLRLEAQA